MIDTLRLLLGTSLRLFCARRSLLLENLALRQQLGALKRRRPRPRLAVFDKVFWVLAREYWTGWKQALIVVTPETVVRWHRAGFRLYWKLISKVPRPIGRRPTPEVQEPGSRSRSVEFGWKLCWSIQPKISLRMNRKFDWMRKYGVSPFGAYL